MHCACVSGNQYVISYWSVYTFCSYARGVEHRRRCDPYHCITALLQYVLIWDLVCQLISIRSHRGRRSIARVLILCSILQ